MSLRDILVRSRIGWREFIPALILVVNSFSWYSVMLLVFADTVNNLQIGVTMVFGLFGTFYIGIAVSAIVIHLLFRQSRNSILMVWLFLGIVASLLFSLIETGTYLTAFAISLFQGVSIGIGLPSCLAYFADLTVVENRGFLGGITYGFSALAMFILVYTFSLFGPSVSILLSIWRGLGLIFFAPFMKKKPYQNSRPTPSYSSILRTRKLALYLAPWIMFCLVNWIEAPLVEKIFGDFYSFVISAEFAISGISALIGGLFADLVGRKRVIIGGFILLGIEYATLGLLPETLFSQYLYTVLDGISWGMFSVVFFMVLWGDLAENNRKEKHYVIGGLPYLLANFLSVLVRPNIEGINVNTAFSLASFFLFVAVLPLMYAPETLPEKTIKDRELKSYIEKAKKTKEKYA